MENEDIRELRRTDTVDNIASDKDYETVYTKRIWTRDEDDLYGGAMSSMHSFVSVNKETNQVRAEISFRDCHNQIAYVHWVEGRQAHVDKARKSLYKVKDMLDSYIEEFEKTCDDLDLSDK
jgi:hypothetical protein